MVLVANAVMYLAALTLALCVVTPVAEDAPRRVRAARVTLAIGGGASITAAITLTFLGLWLESAIVGCLALAIVCICMWLALTRSSSSERDDGEDGSDGGGGRPRRPVPPAPPEPLGGPDLDWGEFDRARAGWSRERRPIPA